MPKTKAIWFFAAALSLAAGAVAIAQTNTQPTAGQSNQPHIPKNPNIVISYEPPTNPLYQEVYNDLKARHVLEELQHFLAFIHYPRPLSVKLTTCGEANSWYDSHLQGVELCYEIVDWIRRVAPTQPQVGNLTGRTPLSARSFRSSCMNSATPPSTNSRCRSPAVRKMRPISFPPT